MPANFADLLTVSGLVTVTVLLVGLLKRLNPPDGHELKPVADWIKTNHFLTSLIVAFTIAGAAYLVKLYDQLPVVEHYWQGVLFLWAVAQALYNGQKGLSNVLKGQPN